MSCLLLLPALFFVLQARGQLPMPDWVCAGTIKHYWVTPTAGSTYIWKINGITQSTITNEIIITWDVVNYPPSGSPYTLTVQEQSVTGCLGEVKSGQVIVNSQSLVVTFTPCFYPVTTLNAKPFKLKGGLPLGGTYSGNGVNSLTGIFTPANAGTGMHTLTYSYNSPSGCSASAGTPMTVNQDLAFNCGDPLIDFRDNNKSYPTVSIGTQCWLAINLDYGQRINGSEIQTDNCTTEKYCYNDNATNCSSNGGLYQWDELMNYDQATSNLGICPPGWHVPSESDWTILFNYYQGSSLAGRLMLEQYNSDFGALLSGVMYMNTAWVFKDAGTLFWSSDPDGTIMAISHGLNTINNSVSYYPATRTNAFSVRCLKD